MSGTVGTDARRCCAPSAADRSLFCLYVLTGAAGHYARPRAGSGPRCSGRPPGIALGALLCSATGCGRSSSFRRPRACRRGSRRCRRCLLLAAGHTVRGAAWRRIWSTAMPAVVTRCRIPRNSFRFAGVALLAATARGATINALGSVITGYGAVDQLRRSLAVADAGQRRRHAAGRAADRARKSGRIELADWPDGRDAAAC